MPDPDFAVRGGGVWGGVGEGRSDLKIREGAGPPGPSPGSTTAGSPSHLPFSYRTNGTRQHKHAGVFKENIVYQGKPVDKLVQQQC